MKVLRKVGPRARAYRSSDCERSHLVGHAPMTVAANARSEALIMPGGFPDERARQVHLLRKMADMVEVDEPDLEMERLGHEGDVDGIVRRLRDALEGGTDG